MALRYIDSFDFYQTADIARRWTSVFSPAQVTINPTAGRCNSQCLQLAGGFSHVYKGVVTSGDTVIFGMAVQIDTDALAGDVPFFTFGTGSYAHLRFFRVWNDGSIQVNRTAVTGEVVIGNTSADVLRLDRWYYVEIKVVLSLTAGSIDVRVNANNVLSLSGIRTVGYGLSDLATTTTWFGFESTNTSNYFIDDVYVADGTAGTVANFIGDVTVEYLETIADGVNSAWSLQGAPTRWQAINDDSAPDGDTDYIYADTAGVVNTSDFESPTLVTADVYGVQVNIDAEKEDSGDRAIAAVVRHAGVDNIGSNLYPSEGNFLVLSTIYDKNPGTSSQWTLADVQAAEFGVKLTI